MIFLLLNLFITASFIFLIIYTDRSAKTSVKDAGVLLIPLLIGTAETVLFSIILLAKNILIEPFMIQLMKIVFCLDGFFFVLLSFSFIGIIANTKKFFIRVIELALCVFVCYIVYKKFTTVPVKTDYSLIIGAPKLFEGEVGKFFTMSWVDFFDFFFKGCLPITTYLFLILLQEKNGNQLQRYQGFLIGLSLLLLWVLSYFFKNFMANANSGFTSLFMLPYVAMFVLIEVALERTSVPSGKGVFANIVQMFITYVLPAGILGFVVMYLQPIVTNPILNFLCFAGCAILAVTFSIKLSQIVASSKRMYTADYAVALEKDLASIDYSGEMDQITGRMNEIFRRNVESSSMNVYVLNNKGVLETAYSSNNMHKQIQTSNPIFDELLNIEKSVVLYSEIGHVHDISPIDEKLEEFFKDTNSDALFLLNEGRNILGLITLGKKVSGDHYKEYDLKVFNKLYSYFFVFGYYMRNISNKEIISVVNREIKMSSQIITSIQENIDHVKNLKIDTGYMMVPARNLGGEFIDMIRLTDTRHLFVIGDLSGKGIAASMNMVILKSIIRTYLAETHDFKELVVKINSFIRTSLRKGTIFAGIFALVDFETDTMYYINCGIPTLMLYTQVYNNVIEIQGSGHVLGFVKDLSPFVSVKTTKLNPGDIILGCTDGLVQSHSLRGEQFGKERIQQCLLDNSTYPAQRMAQFTFDTLTKFMSKEMEDDVSILVLKYGTGERAEINTEEKTVVETPAAPVIEEAPATEEASASEETAASEVKEEVTETGAESASPVEEKMDITIPEVSDEEIAAAMAMAQAEIANEDMFVSPIDEIGLPNNE